MEEPNIGKAQGGPPSLYTRIPTKAIWDSNGARNPGKGFTPSELQQFAALCAYANNQGFAYPNQQTLADVSNSSRGAIVRMIKKAKRLGYIERVSVYRQHPKWRHVMGAVWRIIYDNRLTQDDLIDDMNRNDPAPISEQDIALNKSMVGESGKQAVTEDRLELVVANALAHWYCRLVNDMTGELRIVNERAIQHAAECHNIELAKAAAESHLVKCRNDKQSAPPTMAAFKQPSQDQMTK